MVLNLDEILRANRDAAGTSFPMRSRAKCRLDRDSPAEREVFLEPGTEVESQDTGYDSMGHRAMHRMKVLSGPYAGKSVDYATAIESFPWE